MLNLKKLSILSTGTLIAALGTFGNSAQAASMKDEYITFNKNVVVDFDENVGVGSNPLTGGPKLDQLWADYGLEMDSSVKELWLYDSNCKAKANGKRTGVSKNGFTNICTGDDPDLATGKGKYRAKNGNLIKYDSPEQSKVLIIQENNGAPDDYANRNNPGTISFNFTDEKGVDFNNIGLLDFDDPGQPIFNFTFLDNTTQQFQFGVDADENDPMVTLLSKDWNGNALKGDNSLREYKFDFSQNIKQLEVTLPGSGAVTYLDYERTIKRKVPEPTSILSLIFVTVAIAKIKRKRSS
ncbi:PEP-CTERM putative exosortase interaction domain-containing protein [Rivularia sp. PCC 7116]|uniref:PEP-CTERM sorting domain-containing protein n=1 Tax=Rivularia sp. PCC 7116 TaxID=373994 RepID=UPI00029F386F|nr:PEP-CTERM sorting domain-containing protein [Rivularia sp. PCC 7116]AFY58863.1 PEP-CTERM putative exosortase interaction domain-containing protein [Rivularia sp. PCC 7116]